jgi:hypothetical protein
MRRLLQKIGEWFRELRKDADVLLDVFRPRGWVEIRLIHAKGPQKGQVARSERFAMRTPVLGRNVVTGFVPNRAGPIYSGRDIMRRLLLLSSNPDELSGDDYKVGYIQLGAGTTAESSADYALASAIANSMKVISDTELDGSNPYVTFIAQWEEDEVNVSISEAMLWSNDSDPSTAHPYARKTFTAFTKTNDFTLQVRWQIRF